MKKFYQENRVFSILMIVAITCFLIICFLFFRYFFVGTSKSNYGSRLDVIKTNIIKDSQLKALEKEYLEDEIITKATLNVKGRIIYIELEFNDSTTLVTAQSKAILALDKLEDYQDLYDIQIFIKNGDSAEEAFVIMGAKNITSKSIIWNNNTVSES